MRKEELFRFFDKEPNIDLVHKVLEEMIIYWTLDQINNLSVYDIKTPVYMQVNNNQYEEIREVVDNLDWGDIGNIEIDILSYKIKDILVENSHMSSSSNYCITGDTHGNLDFEVFYEAVKKDVKIYSFVEILGIYGMGV